jgi:UDP-N-acetylglucosamine enolpyruvyl transferase
LTDRLGEGPIRVTRKNFQSRFAHVEEMLRAERLGGRLFCIRRQEV